MDYFHALQCRAVLGALRPTQDSWLRKVMRCYSRWFSTPLHEVYDLPLEDVLLAYFEERFEQMDEEERDEFLETLVETDEERSARAKHDADADQAGEDFFETLNQQVSEDVRRGKPAPAARKKPKAKLPGRLPAFESKEPDSEPVVEMTFDEGGNLSAEDLMSGDPLGDPVKKKV